MLSTFPGHAQVVRIVKNLSGETVPYYRTDTLAIDGAGATAFAVASSDQYGANGAFKNQIFQWSPASGVGTQLTNFDLGVTTVSVSDDGQWLAFVSNSDLTGTNHDESSELFVMHPDGTGLTQITSDTTRVGDGVGTAAISGSGTRIVFTSDTDPLGTNPGHTPHYFAIDRNGANLVQLAAATFTYDAASISDDGSRIAFFVYDFISNSGAVYASPSDGSTAPAALTTVFGKPITKVALSGNGQVVVFARGSTDTGKVNFDGTGLILPLADGPSPSITDDGSMVYFIANGVSKIPSDRSTSAVVVAASSPTLTYAAPLVSGDGSRVVAVNSSGQIPGGSNPDSGPEIDAMDSSGSALRQLSVMSVRPATCFAPTSNDTLTGPRILTNGSRIYFVSDGDLLGTNADHSFEVFTILPGGTGLTQITNQSADVETLSVSDSGLIVFESNGEFYKVNTNRTGLAKVTNFAGGTAFGRFPTVRFDGQSIFYEGQNVGGAWGLYSLPITGGTATSIAQVDPGVIFHYRLGAIPFTYVVYDGPSNGDHHFQIQRVGYTGVGYLRITADPTYDSMFPDVSGDGNKIVWISQADFTGQNPGHNAQVFLYDVPTATKRQLSNATGSSQAGVPAITRDGSWVYYNLDDDVLRVSVATGAVQRVTGFTPGSAKFADVDGTGARTLFTGSGVIRQSLSGPSLFLADQTPKPAFHVGKAAPTLLDWDPDPQSLTFDVIRGDLANLSTFMGTVNLGPVTCVEDNSPDNQTLGNEDATQPAPGHGFFYLYRGTLGYPAVAGSWGQGTGALERVPSAGSCSP